MPDITPHDNFSPCTVLQFVWVTLSGDNIFKGGLWLDQKIKESSYHILITKNRITNAS